MLDCYIIRAGEQFPGIDITQNLSRSSHFISRQGNLRGQKSRANFLSTSREEQWKASWLEVQAQPRTEALSVPVSRASAISLEWDVCPEPKEDLKTTPTSATVWPPCCHLAKDTEVFALDYRAASDCETAELILQTPPLKVYFCGLIIYSLVCITFVFCIRDMTRHPGKSIN